MHSHSFVALRTLDLMRSTKFKMLFEFIIGVRVSAVNKTRNEFFWTLFFEPMINCSAEPTQDFKVFKPQVFFRFREGSKTNTFILAMFLIVVRGAALASKP